MYTVRILKFKIKMSDRNFTRFDVVVTSLSSDRKITVIYAVRGVIVH